MQSSTATTRETHPQDIAINENLHVNPDGFYGRFGGAFVTPALEKNIKELAACYAEIIDSPEFQQRYRELLRDYVGRPSPLYLSRSLSERHGCRVYLKREDLNHTGAHKINNAIGQVLLAKAMGKKRVIAETGAGQHGVATATVCALFQMPCTIYMGAMDIERQHLNVDKMKLLGAEIRAATAGNATLSNAVEAALEEWSLHPEDTFYMLGSAVGPHPYPDIVARLQSIISEELRHQLLEKEGTELPTHVVACIGGGSNAAGSFYHFIDDANVQLVLAEAAGMGTSTEETAASLTLGEESLLHGSRSLVLLDGEGKVREAYSVSAGLDYPGSGPLMASLVEQKRAQVVPVTDDEAIAAALRLNRQEGILPALESAHALAALDRLAFEPKDVVVMTLSGRGDKDIDVYLEHAKSLEQ
ncbi:MAG: tryptophan synthase subunit beta [Bacteroidetes bacterium]|nr:MAG: tryptophan synthase subunit beta [Bacteroidota bacterium]